MFYYQNPSGCQRHKAKVCRAHRKGIDSYRTITCSDKNGGVASTMFPCISQLLPGIRRLINLLTILKCRYFPCISRASAVQRILCHLWDRRIERLSRNAILLQCRHFAYLTDMFNGFQKLFCCIRTSHNKYVMYVCKLTSSSCFFSL